MKIKVGTGIARTFWIMLLLVYSLACQPSYTPDEGIAEQLPATVDFNYHIKPILSDRCFSCHGPDKNALKADLQLHTPEGGLEQVLSSGGHAFVPGNIRKSEAFQRIITTDTEQQMPPVEFQRHLSSYEIALIAKWIEQGAVYKPHWAFIPPAKVEIPLVKDSSWCRNPIDYFVVNRLEEEGLIPKNPADKALLLRRVSLDLTGLPPTLQEIDDFLADNSPSAYEKVVDRLLASPHFGERMALAWLDMARYADSNGYSQDGLRIMWPWRDWVIQAFNENMAYDQFVSWQIAGDRLPAARQEQKLATGFLRNHRLNGEGGIVDEEYRIEYAADRTETAATVLLGLTMQCARCHDHKYDPISQEEYYQFFSFFNNVHETGITANDGNSGPELVLTPKEVADQIAFLDKMILAEQDKAISISNTVPSSLVQQSTWDLNEGLLVDLTFDEITDRGLLNQAVPGQYFSIGGQPGQVEGVNGKGIKITAFDFINISEEQLSFDRADAFSYSFYFKNEQDYPYTGIVNKLGSRAVNAPGYEIALVDGYPTMRLVHSYPAVMIEVQGETALEKGAWTALTFTYDGSGEGRGITLYIAGQKAPVRIVFDKLKQSMANNRRSVSIGGRIGYQTAIDGYGMIDDLKVYNRCLSAVEVCALQDPDAVESMKAEQYKDHFLATKHSKYGEVTRKIEQLRREKFQIEDTLTSVMVMEDLPIPRPTFILNRGAYDAPGEAVSPSTPKVILPFSDTLSKDRAGLAGWLLDRKNPLTARVAVNRFWQLYFGQGLVKTSDDFGSQGALPSHPGLLDWLATYFMESGWDLKGLQKLIVLSATYRQSSRVEAAARKADPDNERLARGPDRRLSAEVIRDVALAASGLLVRKIGGPSVKPYQPEGLWSEKGEFSILKNYVQDKGDKLYRRSLYTFWRRSSPPPSMVTFDAPSREFCLVSRQETNTPLQALVLLNDPQFVEAARVLAENVIRKETDKRAQVVRAYRLLTGLSPQAEVVNLLLELEQKEFAKFDEIPQLAKDLLEVGEYPAARDLKPAAVAAMTIICSTIMSFDETLVKR